jgi:hypothetical protein
MQRIADSASHGIERQSHEARWTREAYADWNIYTSLANAP